MQHVSLPSTHHPLWPEVQEVQQELEREELQEEPEAWMEVGVASWPCVQVLASLPPWPAHLAVKPAHSVTSLHMHLAVKVESSHLAEVAAVQLSALDYPEPSARFLAYHFSVFGQPWTPSQLLKTGQLARKVVVEPVVVLEYLQRERAFQEALHLPVQQRRLQTPLLFDEQPPNRGLLSIHQSTTCQA